MPSDVRVPLSLHFTRLKLRPNVSQKGKYEYECPCRGKGPGTLQIACLFVAARPLDDSAALATAVIDTYFSPTRLTYDRVYQEMVEAKAPYPAIAPTGVKVGEGGFCLPAAGGTGVTLSCTALTA